MSLGRKSKRLIRPFEEMHLAGLNYEQIAQLMGYAKKGVYDALHKIGYSLSTGRSVGVKKNWNGVRPFEEMFLAGLNHLEIAALLGFQPQYIRQALNALGYKPSTGKPHGHGLRQHHHLEAKAAQLHKRRHVNAWHASGKEGSAVASYWRYLSKIE